MSTTAAHSAADAYLARHEARAPVRTCRCTVTIQAPPGQEIDDDMIADALQRVKLPKGYRITETAVHRGWQEAAE